MTRIPSNPTEGRHLFIVRFWREDSQGAPGGQWRGSVEHIPTGERAHFVSLEVLDEFINTHLSGESTQADDRKIG